MGFPIKAFKCLRREFVLGDEGEGEEEEEGPEEEAAEDDEAADEEEEEEEEAAEEDEEEEEEEDGEEEEEEEELRTPLEGEDEGPAVNEEVDPEGDTTRSVVECFLPLFDECLLDLLLEDLAGDSGGSSMLAVDELFPPFLLSFL